MSRTHWILLSIGALVIVAVTLMRTRQPPVPADLPPELASEPELYMRGAVITQFGDDGSLHYRLRAAQLFHYPDQQRSLLEAPRLHFIRDDAVPWDASSDRGRVEYLDDGNGRQREIVHMEDNVELLRQRPAQARFLRLETTTLTVHPDTEYAETDAPVVITTEVGTTWATGMQAQLDVGQLHLGPAPDARVTTRITRPDLLEADPGPDQ